MLGGKERWKVAEWTSKLSKFPGETMGNTLMEGRMSILIY